MEPRGTATQGKSGPTAARSVTADLETRPERQDPIECAVCLQPCVHPVILECRHIFCYLCVKGVSIQSKRCPMCRREISPGYLVNPVLVHQTGNVPTAGSASRPADPQAPSTTVSSGRKGTSEVGVVEGPSGVGAFRWFYEGRNGWWEYDERTACELEEAFLKTEEGSTPRNVAPTADGDPDDGDDSRVAAAPAGRRCELLIAGSLYTIDFENMLQFRRNDPSRRRRMRRDLTGNVENCKGVAGLRIAPGAAAGAVADDAVAAGAVVAVAGGADLSKATTTTLPEEQVMRPHQEISERLRRGEGTNGSRGARATTFTTTNTDDDDDRRVVVTRSVSAASARGQVSTSRPQSRADHQDGSL